MTVLLGAPPGWGSEPTVVPLSRRRPGVRAGEPLEPARDVPARVDAAADVDSTPHDDDVRPVVELDEVERKAVRALADFGLVPPLRHQDATTRGDRHVS
nr:hypothetical protein [uncultured Modestobacter sp.]